MEREKQQRVEGGNKQQPGYEEEESARCAWDMLGPSKFVCRVASGTSAIIMPSPSINKTATPTASAKNTTQPPQTPYLWEVQQAHERLHVCQLHALRERSRIQPLGVAALIVQEALPQLDLF